MAYCAVNLKTESGDSYTVLVEYRSFSDIPTYLHSILDDEFAYVSEVEVDSGVDAPTDDKIEEKILNAVKTFELDSGE